MRELLRFEENNSGSVRFPVAINILVLRSPSPLPSPQGEGEPPPLRQITAALTWSSSVAPSPWGEGRAEGERDRMTGARQGFKRTTWVSVRIQPSRLNQSRESL